MTALPCPVRGCGRLAPDEPFAVFCSTHHFMLPRAETGMLFRLQMKAARCPDPAKRQHLHEQLPGYIAQAVRKIEQSAASTSSPTPAASAARHIPTPAGGANNFTTRS